MVAYFTTPVRVLLLAAALAFAAQTVAANEPAPTPTARTTARTKTAATVQQEELPMDGVLIIAGVVGMVILLAWVCSRIGDNSSHITG